MATCVSDKPKKPTKGTMFEIIENRAQAKQANLIQLEMVWRMVRYKQIYGDKK